MDKVKIRLSAPEDIHELKALWRHAFGDSEEYISSFFRHHYQEGMAMVLEEGGKIMSAAYILPGITLQTGAGPVDCWYMYALGTRQEARGKGFGAAVMRACADRIHQTRPGMVCLYPAEPSLYRWYDRITGYRERFYLRERRYTRCELEGGSAPVSLRGLKASAYNALREGLLEGKAHTSYSQSLMEWQHFLCQSYGGALVGLQGGKGAGCAILERGGDTMYVKELLLPEGDFFNALSSIAEHFPAREYLVRAPLFWGENDGLPPREFVIRIPGGDEKAIIEKDAYWGLVFD